jgi:hypothetical protein
MFVPYGWDGTFGAALTVTLMLKHSKHGRVCLPAGHPALEGMRDGHFIAALVREDQLVAAFEVDASQLHGEWAFSLQWERVRTHIPNFADPRASYWEVLGHMGFLHKYCTPDDHLALGWAKKFAQYVDGLASGNLDGVKGEPFPPITKPLPSVLAKFIGAMQAPNWTAGDLLRAIRDVHAGGDAALLELLRLQTTYLDLCHGLTKHRHCGFFNIALQAHLFSSAVTQEGRRVPWFDGVNGGTLQYLDLAPAQFSPSCPAGEYWERIPRGLPENLGHLVSGSEVPIKLAVDAPEWSSFPLADNADEVSASADALLDEALANKANCIPNGAIIQAAYGPFEHIQAWERPGQVDFVCRKPNGEFALAHLNLVERQLSFELLWHCRDGEQARRIEVGLKLFLAATVRDFFVVEERERVFLTKEATKAPRGIRAPSEGPTIIYLPRVKYRSIPNLKRCSEDLDLLARRAHVVTAHLRKSANVSEHQLILAARYGLDVPKGFTFVRPHERGQKERKVIFRSRSALRALYDVEPSREGRAGAPNWFKFERDVQTLMRTLGFSVEHVAASRNGDQGIDVLAVKGEDLDEVRWLIQCKCFSPKNKVGPAVIRELLGTLKPQRAGTRGMVVTTSTFTEGARELAGAEGIRLMDGAEFAARLKAQSVSGE